MERRPATSRMVSRMGEHGTPGGEQSSRKSTALDSDKYGLLFQAAPWMSNLVSPGF